MARVWDAMLFALNETRDPEGSAGAGRARVVAPPLRACMTPPSRPTAPPPQSNKMKAVAIILLALVASASAAESGEDGWMGGGCQKSDNMDSVRGRDPRVTGLEEPCISASAFLAGIPAGVRACLTRGGLLALPPRGWR